MRKIKAKVVIELTIKNTGPRVALRDALNGLTLSYPDPVNDNMKVIDQDLIEWEIGFLK